MSASLAKLEALAARARQGMGNMLAQRIRSGLPTTWEYRKFCRTCGTAVDKGVYLANSPWPFPLNDPMECRRCGFIMSREDRESPENAEVVNPGCYCGPAEWWREPDVMARCPECGAPESMFALAIVCAECNEYPCICEQWDYLQPDSWWPGRRQERAG